ncbi:ketopantoate reductase ApbA/PanE domain-containing protein [Flammeovirgaceae bacterium 311]|nr:ketopantoate reductase ApbA/PanE domain-containing protein [Flammeovirgaceae bacterium 311]
MYRRLAAGTRHFNHMTMNNEKIFIVGSGAIGRALAVFLTLNNRQVVMLRGSVDEGESYRSQVRVELMNQESLEATFQTSTLGSFSELDGLIVLTNKSYGNKRLSSLLKGKIKDAPLVILQNGLGVEQPFAEEGFPEIYRCVLFATSQITSAHTLSFKPVAESPIGVIRGGGAKLQAVVAQLSSKYFQFRLESDIQPIIWEKTIINCVFNSICPLLDVDNGIFYRNKDALNIAKRVIGECVEIAKGNAIKLDPDEILAKLLLISRSSEGQLISTLQDIKNGRETEIDTLNFEIVQAAAKIGKEELVKDTLLLGELTKLKAKIFN